MNNIKTRFAPSPTGALHIGSIRTALFSWLYSKQNNGKFVLRIDDTDHDRTFDQLVNNITDTMKWLNLNWDEGPYYQSKRFKRYNTIIEDMLAKGTAYRCFCSTERLKSLREKQIIYGEKPRYDGYCRNNGNKNSNLMPHVIRFRNPQTGYVIFNDYIRGMIKFDNTELDDVIIKRVDGTPTYNFCAVIDDWDMNITHVIRGEEHINNTPRQINILTSLGAPIPTYAHVSMILEHDGKKMSKRHEAINVMQYFYDGYLPEAILNYIIRLGWGYANKEIFSLPEMIKLFSLKKVTKSASIFDIQKLQWYNYHYMNSLSPNYVGKELTKHMEIKDFNLNYGPNITDIVKLYRTRCKTLKEMATLSHYFYNDINLSNNILAKQYLLPVIYYPLKVLLTQLKTINQWSLESIKYMIKSIVTQFVINLKLFYMALRISLTGIEITPNLSEIIYILGPKYTLKRIECALIYIKNINSK
uniref:Glutamate--tRNA ligase n=1 Tax=Candidatus Aschnera chinzeii TaxID=1485666 RepID=A0AAT9G4Z2_9ENTR|nr:MAG: glutamate--tRNA ligase [Candidatus Aschnera chinzeii]